MNPPLEIFLPFILSVHHDIDRFFVGIEPCIERNLHEGLLFIYVNPVILAVNPRLCTIGGRIILSICMIITQQQHPVQLQNPHMYSFSLR